MMIAIASLGIWLILGIGTVYVDKMSESDLIKAGVCLRQNARLVRMGGMDYCDFGPDPTEGI